MSPVPRPHTATVCAQPRFLGSLSGPPPDTPRTPREELSRLLTNTFAAPISALPLTTALRHAGHQDIPSTPLLFISGNTRYPSHQNKARGICTATRTATNFDRLSAALAKRAVGMQLDAEQVEQDDGAAFGDALKGILETASAMGEVGLDADATYGTLVPKSQRAKKGA